MKIQANTGFGKTKAEVIKPARWKYWWSYLNEVHIESAPSRHNPHLYVSLKRGRFQLSAARAVYSYGDLYLNFRKTFEKIALPSDHSRVLLLGLGLGSIPLMLERVFKRRYHFTAIELDEQVIALAEKYVLRDLQAPITSVCADACAFMLQQTETFDLICMDVFQDDQTPADFEKREFLKALQEALTPDGTLIYNRLAYYPEDRALSRHFYEGSFSEIFPNAEVLDVQSNLMLLGYGAP